MKQHNGIIPYSVAQKIPLTEGLQRRRLSLKRKKEHHRKTIAGIIAASSSTTLLVSSIALSYYLYRRRQRTISVTIPCTESIKRVDIGGAVDLYLTFGQKTSITLYAKSYLMPKVCVRLKENCLTAFIAGGSKRSTKNHVRLMVTLPNVEKITTSGASQMIATGINRSETFTLEQFSQKISGLEVKSQYAEISICGNCSSQMSVRANNLNLNLVGDAHADIEADVTEKTDLDLDGASYLFLSGKTQELIVRNSAQAQLDGSTLKVEQGKVGLRNGASAHLNVRKNLSIELSGNSTLSLTQKPEKIQMEVIKDKATIQYINNSLKTAQ